MSMVKDIKDYLIDEGVTLDIFKSQQPNKTDTSISLFQYGGGSPMVMAKIQELGLQVVSRSRDYETAMSNIESVAPILNRIGDEINATFDSAGNVTNGLYPAGITINSILYTRAIENQAAFQVGKDDNNRHEIKQNFTISRRNQ